MKPFLWISKLSALTLVVCVLCPSAMSCVGCVWHEAYLGDWKRDLAIEEDSISFSAKGWVGISPSHSTGYCLMVVNPDTPASASGFVSQDRLFFVDKIPVKGLSSQDVFNLLNGPIGTKVSVGYIKGWSSKRCPEVKELTRVDFTSTLQKGSVTQEQTEAENDILKCAAVNPDDPEILAASTWRVEKYLKQRGRYVALIALQRARVNQLESILGGPTLTSIRERLELAQLLEKNEQNESAAKELAVINTWMENDKDNSEERDRAELLIECAAISAKLGDRLQATQFLSLGLANKAWQFKVWSAAANVFADLGEHSTSVRLFQEHFSRYGDSVMRPSDNQNFG